LHFLEVIIGLPQTEHINATTSDFRLDSRKGNPRFSDKLWAGYSHQAFHWNGFWAKETTNMNDARRCLVMNFAGGIRKHRDDRRYADAGRARVGHLPTAPIGTREEMIDNSLVVLKRG
jgi:hypothetical protein